MVKGEQVASVSKWLKEHSIEHSVMVDNVQDLVDQSKKDMLASRNKDRSNTNLAMDWEDYQPLDVLNSFIQSLADANEFARIINIGQSYEGRDMKVLAVEKVDKTKTISPCISCSQGRSWRPQRVARVWYPRQGVDCPRCGHVPCQRACEQQPRPP